MARGANARQQPKAGLSEELKRRLREAGALLLLPLAALIVCLVRAYKGHFRPEQHFGFEAAAWYWHFVDVVWLFLFAAIYVWGAGPNPGGAGH